MKCIVLKPSHIQGFLCNFKIEGDISISLHKKWSWTPCMFVYIFRKCKYTTICGTKQIKQEEYCYKKGSKCERLFKEGKLFRSKETKTESIYFETVNGKEEVLKKPKAALALA